MVPGVATAAAQLLRWGRCWLTVAALVASAQTGRAQESITCIIKADTGNAYIGRVSALRGLPGDGVLLGAEKGLFLARLVNGALTVDRALNADTGIVFAILDLPGGAVLIRAQKGSFLARVVNGVVSIDSCRPNSVPVTSSDTGKLPS